MKGINKQMKVQGYILVFFGIFASQILPAQINVEIKKDTTSECDSMLIRFSYTTNVPVTATTLHWSFGDGKTSNVVEDVVKHYYTAPGTYNVKVKINGTDSTDLDVTVGMRPRVNIYYRDTSEMGPYNFLVGAYTPTSYKYTYQWYSNETDIAVNDTDRFIHGFVKEGYYQVRLISKEPVHGCIDTSYRILDITNTIEAPNVFTPNGDGKNDEFVVRSNGRYFISLKVFTRTGLIVYKTEAKTISWDGRLQNGDKVSPGMYYYIMETTDANPPVKKTGFVYIYP